MDETENSLKASAAETLSEEQKKTEKRPSLPRRIIENSGTRRQEQAEKQELQTRAEQLSAQSETLNYPMGQGVISAVSRGKEGIAPKPIKAPDFKDCCSVVMQSLDAISIIHISPLTTHNNEVNQTVDYSGEVRKKDFDIHLNAAITKMLEKPNEADFQVLEPEKAEALKLSEEQLKQAEEEIDITLIGGNQALANEVYNRFRYPAQNLITPSGANIRLPKIECGYNMYGNGPKTILADNKDLLVVEQEGNNIIKVPKTQRNLV